MNRNNGIPGWLAKCFWLMVLILLALAYLPLNESREPLHSLATTIDNRIPLLPVFVFPYLSIFVLLAISLWRFLKSETRIFSIAVLAVGIDLVVSYLVFFFYQTHVERPLIVNSDVSSSILKAIYSFDKPFNAFPSLHTSISTLLVLLWGKAGSRLQPVIAVWAALIIASTLLTKQHYIADVGGGIAAALVSYYGAVQLDSFAAGRAKKRFPCWRRRSR